MNNIFLKNQVGILGERQQRKNWVSQVWLCFLMFFNLKGALHGFRLAMVLLEKEEAQVPMISDN